MIPPPVGPTVRRVAYVIRIGLRPRIVSEDLPRGLVVVVTGCVLIRTFLCCVSCVPPVSAVACILSDSACYLGLY